jgi:hypothetical protein
MIGVQNLKITAKRWTELKSVGQKKSTTKRYKITTAEVGSVEIGESNMAQTFNNVNEERNNNYECGFGNFLSLGKNTNLYAFLTLDYFVKIYQIPV